MDNKVAEILSKKTAFRSVEKMEGSRVSKDYVGYLSYLGLVELAKEVDECKHHVIEQHCLGQKAHSSWALRLCRQDKACLNEDMIETAWEMNDMELYLQFLFEHAGLKKHVWYVDFTVGSDVRKRIPWHNLSSFAGLAYEVMQEYFRKKLKYDAEFGMDIAPQFWGSEEPGEGYKPHLHAIIPRVFIERQSPKVLDIRTNRLGSEEDLSELKRMWRKKVESVYGRSRARVKGKYEEFSVRVAWKGEEEFDLGPRKRRIRSYRASMRHRLKYMYRGIVFDIEKSFETKRRRMGPVDFGEWDSAFVRCALTTNHKRHIGYGLMSSKGRSKRSRYMRRIGMDFGTRQQRRKLLRKKCPEVENGKECGCYIQRWDGDKIIPVERGVGRGLRTVVRRWEVDALTDVQRRYQRDYARSS